MDTSNEEDFEGAVVEGEMGSEEVEADMEDFPDEWMVLDDMDEETEDHVHIDAGAAGDGAKSQTETKVERSKCSDVPKETTAATFKKPSVQVESEPLKSVADQNQSEAKNAQSAFKVPAKPTQPVKQTIVKGTQPVKGADAKPTQSAAQVCAKTPAKQVQPAQTQVKKAMPAKTIAVSGKQTQSVSGQAKQGTPQPAPGASPSSIQMSAKAVPLPAKTAQTPAGPKQTGPIRSENQVPRSVTPTRMKSPGQAGPTVKTAPASGAAGQTTKPGQSKTGPIVKTAPASGAVGQTTKPGQSPQAKPGTVKPPQVQAKPAVVHSKPLPQMKPVPAKPAIQSNSTGQSKVVTQASPTVQAKPPGLARPADQSKPSPQTKLAAQASTQGSSKPSVQVKLAFQSRPETPKMGTSADQVQANTSAQSACSNASRSSSVFTTEKVDESTVDGKRIENEAKLPADVKLATDPVRQGSVKSEPDDAGDKDSLNKKLVSGTVAKHEKVIDQQSSKADPGRGNEGISDKVIDKDEKAKDQRCDKSAKEGGKPTMDKKDNGASNVSDKEDRSVDEPSEDKVANKEVDKSKSITSGKTDAKSGDRPKETSRSSDRSKDSNRTRSPARGRSRDRYEYSSDRRDRGRSDYSSRHRRSSRDREFARPGDRKSTSDTKISVDRRNSSSSAKKSGTSASRTSTPVKRTAAGEKKVAETDSKGDTPQTKSTQLEVKKSAQGEKAVVKMSDRGMQTDAVKFQDQISKASEKGSSTASVKQTVARLAKETKKIEEVEKHELLDFKCNTMEEGLWRFAVRLVPVELADIAQEPFRKLLNGAQDCTVFLKNQGTGRKKKGEAKMFFTRMQMTKYAMQKLFQTPVTSKKLDVEISRKILGSSDKKDIVVLDLDLTNCGLLGQTGTTSTPKDASGAAEDKNVHISNVPKGTTQELLFVIFPTALTIEMPKEGHVKGLVVVQFRSSQYAQDIVRCYAGITINKVKLSVSWKRMSRDRLPEPQPQPAQIPHGPNVVFVTPQNPEKEFRCPECVCSYTKKVNLKAHLAQHRMGKIFVTKPLTKKSTEKEQSVFHIPVRDTSRTDKADTQVSHGSRGLRDRWNTSAGDSEAAAGHPHGAKRPRLDLAGISVTVGDTRSVEIWQSDMGSGSYGGQIVEGTEDVSDEDDDEDMIETEAISTEWDQGSLQHQSRAKAVQGASRAVKRMIVDSHVVGRSTRSAERSGNRHDGEAQRSTDRDPSWTDRSKDAPSREPVSSNRTEKGSVERPRSLDRQVRGHSSRRRSVSPVPRYSARGQRRSRSPVKRSNDGRHGSISPPRPKRRQYSRSPPRQTRHVSQSPPRYRKKEYSPLQQKKSSDTQNLSPVSDHSLCGNESSPTKHRRSPARKADTRPRLSYSPAGHGRSPAKDTYSALSLAQSLTQQVEKFIRQGRNTDGQQYSSRQSGSPGRRGNSLTKQGPSPAQKSRSPGGHSHSPPRRNLANRQISPQNQSRSPARRAYSPARLGRSPGRRSPYRTSPLRAGRTPPPRVSDFLQNREALGVGSTQPTLTTPMAQKTQLSSQTSSYTPGSRAPFATPVTSAASGFTSSKLDPVIPGLDLLTASRTPARRSVLDLLTDRSWALTGSSSRGIEDTYRPFPSSDTSKVIPHDEKSGRDLWLGKQDDAGWWGTDRPQSRMFDTPTNRDVPVSSASSRDGLDSKLDLMSLRKEAAKHLASLEKNLHTPTAQQQQRSQEGAMASRPAINKMGDFSKSSLDRPNWEEPRSQQPQNTWGSSQGSSQGQKSALAWDQGGSGGQFSRDSSQGISPPAMSVGQTGNQGGGFGTMSGSRNLQSGSSVRPTWDQDMNAGPRRGGMGPGPAQMGMGSSGGMWQGVGGGLGLMGPRPQGLGMQRSGMSGSGVGMSGSGMSGPGMSGSGMSGPGMSGSGMSGSGMSGSGMSGPGMSGSGMSGPGMSGPGMSGSGMLGPGMSGPGLSGLGMSGPGMSGGPGMLGPGMSGPGMTGMGNDAWLPPPPRPPINFSGSPFPDRMPRPFMPRPPF